MKQALAIRHLAFEDLGLLEPLLVKQGYSIQYLDAGVDSLDKRLLEADLLVILGGPISANDSVFYPFLQDELNLLKQRLQKRHPTLGVCLGAQLMALALGAQVSPMRSKEIGYGPLSLSEAGRNSPLGALPEPISVLHWHGEQFSLPEGAVSLAHTELCNCQAFSLGPSVLGLQFHLEADPTRLEQWLIGHCGELEQNGIPPDKIRQQCQALGNQVALAGTRVFQQWLNTLESTHER
ncbi:glutamine amidotransferase [Marinobacterium sediminicola]|uniref:GMP synthase (Glutamine-hydrolysing) n=1 Tax=Marinobacterium sediminicola TaxID=518898 RepID=A0ABY1RW71_9GAMM|nr:glutamine amidotransferase [Marinobacterium sediminicola]ULG70413.1 glutamine amidotransferase [Marinobacterium sediminicola]SMR69426.1 GMP synthase (glutamine-hydrolysing) [Marinobacterium sediminicola]